MLLLLTAKGFARLSFFSFSILSECADIGAEAKVVNVTYKWLSVSSVRYLLAKNAAAKNRTKRYLFPLQFDDFVFVLSSSIKSKSCDSFLCT